MKKILSYSAVVIICVGCFDTPVEPSTHNFDLGTPSRVMSVTSNSGPVITDTFTITVNVTPGAMYNFQLLHIAGNTIRSHGFTADAEQVTRTFNYSDVPNGAYDFTLMDTNGRLLKVPVIIQH